MILFDEAIICVEATCQRVMSAREYPTHRCPVCGSECLSLRREETKREQQAKPERHAA